MQISAILYSRAWVCCENRSILGSLNRSSSGDMKARGILMRILGAIALIVVIAILLWFVRPGSKPIETIEATLENSILNQSSSEDEEEDNSESVAEPDISSEGQSTDEAPYTASDDPFDTEADASVIGEDEEFVEPALAALPAGPGRELTFYSCTSCHGTDMFLAVGKTRGEWNESLDVMERDRGMYPLEEEDRELVLDYLSTHYGPGSEPPAHIETFDEGTSEEEAGDTTE